MFSFLGRPRGAAALLGASAIALVASVSSAYAQEQQRSFNIPAQSLSSALIEFSRQSDVMVVADPTVVNGRRAPAVQGTFTPSEALSRLLAGSGLTASQRAEGGFVLASASSPTRLGAADGATSSEEIIVTAQKREERLRDVPVPVTALSTQDLSLNNQLRIENYYNQVPGLGLAVVGNGGAPILTIRGITTGDQTNPTVGIVLDGAPYGASVVTVNPPDIDPADLARIEVLRGPQGTLYGASSIGGLINFVTIDPSTEAFSGRVQGGLTSTRYAEELGYNYRGSINVPLGNTLAIRASGFLTHDAGYIDNVQIGVEDANVRENSGGRFALLWQPSDAFSVRLGALKQDSERLGSQDQNRTLGNDPRQRAMRGTGIYNRSTEAYTATINASIANADVTSISNYHTDVQENSLDLSSNASQSARAMTFFGVPGVSVPLKTDVQKFSQELRASIPIGERLNWLVGAFYTTEDIFRANDVDAVDPATGNVAGILLRNAIPNTFEEHAAFTNLTVTFSEQFDVQIGARYSENTQTFSLTRSGPLSTVFFGADPFISPAVRSEDQVFTYLLTPRLRLTPDFMLYARVASGYRPGGPNTNCGAVGIPCQFGADRSVNYELGAKGDLFNGALSYDASAYHIDWEDAQVSASLAAAGAGLGFVSNAGSASSEGVEISLEAHPTQTLTISGFVAWTDAKLEENFPTTSSTRGLRGDRLPYSSPFSASISVDQDFPLWGNARGFIGGTFSHVGERMGVFRSPAQVRERFPGYDELSLRAGIESETWRLNAFVNNATDERGVLRAGLDSIDPAFVTYTQPRTIGLTVSKSF